MDGLELPCEGIQVGLGNISVYRQYCNTGVCNNGYHRHFHMSIISLMQYHIAGIYCKKKYLRI